MRFFDKFSNINGNYSDIEDLFDKEEYINWFTLTFDEFEDIKFEQLDINIYQIIKRINKVIDKPRYNHYRPSHKLTQLDLSAKDFLANILDRFEKMFEEINKLFYLNKQVILFNREKLIIKLMGLFSCFLPFIKGTFMNFV